MCDARMKFNPGEARELQEVTLARKGNSKDILVQSSGRGGLENLHDNGALRGTSTRDHDAAHFHRLEGGERILGDFVWTVHCFDISVSQESLFQQL